MKHTILLTILLTGLLTIDLHAQDTIRVDTVQTSATIQKALPELLTQRDSIDTELKEANERLRHNTEKLMLIISSYVDPRLFVGFTEDKKALIIKK